MLNLPSPGIILNSYTSRGNGHIASLSFFNGEIRTQANQLAFLDSESSEFLVDASPLTQLSSKDKENET